MSWDSTTRMITGAVGMGDISNAVHNTSLDLGTLISQGTIQAGAKYKPFQNTSPAFASSGDYDTARSTANYGLSVPECNSSTLLSSSFQYLRPTGGTYWYRMLDFQSYYEGAPNWPLYCTAGSSFTVNSINTNAGNPCAFFVYEKAGAIADKTPDSSAGTSTTSAGRSSTQIAACLEVSEVKTNGGTALTSLTNPYLGIALYQSSTYKGFAGCSSKLIASQSSRDNDMFIVRREAFNNLALGSYTGKACIRYGSEVGGYGFVPLPNSNFSVTLGGADLYTYFKWGLSASNTTSSMGMIRTTGSTVYITIRVQNNSGIAHQSDANNSTWVLKTTITGTVNGSSITPPDRTLTMNNYYPGTSTFLTIANGGTTDITFKCEKIWNQDPTAAATVVSSGSISIECYLYYNSNGTLTSFTRGAAAQQQALSVTYG